MPDEVPPQGEPTSAAPYKLVFEEHREYFFVCIHAEVLDPRIIDEYQGKIAREIGLRRYNRVIIKRDVPVSDSAGALCALIYRVLGWQMRDIKYAFVDVDPGRLPSYKFALLYAKSNGVNAEVFEDVPSAKDWLLR